MTPIPHEDLKLLTETIQFGTEYDSALQECLELELRKLYLQEDKTWLGRSWQGIVLWQALLLYIAGFWQYLWKMREPMEFAQSRPQVDLSLHKTIYVIYTEWSNRTRHVLKLLDGEHCIVMMVGRLAVPSQIQELKRILSGVDVDHSNWQWVIAGHGCESATVSILDWYTIGRLTLKALRSMNQNSRLDVRDARYIAGVLLRMSLALRYVRWLTPMKKPQKCIFAHTGVADSGAVDYVMRSKGSRTVHYYHGLTHGYNFFAYSSSAVCLSKYCAETTRELGGYATAQYYPLPRPSLIIPKSNNWLLLSNYAHPANVGYQTRGIHNELQLLERVASAYKKIGFTNTHLFWKPHPTIQELPDEQKETIRSRARSLGIVEIEELETSSLARFSMVITTPSTMLVDMLRAGVLPVLDKAFDLPEYHVGRCLDPMLCCDSDTAYFDVYQKITQLTLNEKLFDQAWDRIGPGRAVRTFSQLEVI
ncbi:MAG: hypothetical protein ACI9WC_000189 [Arenicella sp.]|jgi:hypothetical protein